MRYQIFLPTLLLIAACAEKKAVEIKQEEAAVIDNSDEALVDGLLRDNEKQRHIARRVYR